MQTFLPTTNLIAAPRYLSRQHLGKQRIEVLQILRTLAGNARGWRNHPAVAMWAGYEGALVAYGLSACDQWIARGYLDTRRPLIAAYAAPVVHPPWLDEAFCAVHRGVLLDKQPAWYERWGWQERPIERVHGSYPYLWPL